MIKIIDGRTEEKKRKVSYFGPERQGMIFNKDIYVNAWKSWSDLGKQAFCSFLTSSFVCLLNLIEAKNVMIWPSKGKLKLCRNEVDG